MPRKQKSNPKLKTHKGTAKRIHVTGTGKFMRMKGLRSHLRRNGYAGKFVLEVEGKGDQEQVLRDISALFS